MSEETTKPVDVQAIQYFHCEIVQSKVTPVFYSMTIKRLMKVDEAKEAGLGVFPRWEPCGTQIDGLTKLDAECLKNMLETPRLPVRQDTNSLRLVIQKMLSANNHCPLCGLYHGHLPECEVANALKD